MPKAPELTKKQQMQQAVEWRREARREGAKQDFPGAPIWNDWEKEQLKAEKRQLGITKRLGRAAVSTAANLVLIAKETPRAISESREKRSARAVKQYQRNVDLANSRAVLPMTHLGEIAQSRRRRLGLHILSLTNQVYRGRLSHTTRKNERLASKNAAARQDKRRPVEDWANKKLDAHDERNRQAHQRRIDRYNADKQAAWEKHVAEDPELQKRLAAEQDKRDWRYEVRAQNDRYFQMQDKARIAAEHFTNKESYYFSKSLPQRPGFTGSYDELAKSTVEQAASKRFVTGGFSLVNAPAIVDVVLDRLPLSASTAERDGPVIHGDNGNTRTSQNFINNNYQLYNEIEERTDYVGGAATALWKMGFVEYDSEHNIGGSGSSRMNDAIEWSQGEDGATLASLPYNPENELHRIVAGKQADSENARIQLAINDSEEYGPEMNLRLVRQPAYAPAV